MTSHLTTIGTPSLTQASTSRSKPYKLTAKKYACKSGTLPGSKGSKPSPKPTTKAPWVSLWHTLSMISNPSTLCKTGYDKSKPMPHKTSSKSLSLTKLTVTIDVSPMTRVKVLPKALALNSFKSVPNKTKTSPKSLCTWASKSKTNYSPVKSITSRPKVVPKENNLKMSKNNKNPLVVDSVNFISKMR